MNLIINLDHDEWILDDPTKTLEQIGARECLLAPKGRALLSDCVPVPEELP